MLSKAKTRVWKAEREKKGAVPGVAERRGAGKEAEAPPREGA